MIQHHVFGPVASRRLGVSLGIDLVPHKTCSLDCVYCEARRTTCLTTARKEYVPIAEVLQELDQVLKTAPELDFITFSGSGEPTLNSGIGRVVDFIKEHYPQYPVSLLTNGCSLGDREVRREIARVDRIVPSLDASNEEEFRLVSEFRCGGSDAFLSFVEELIGAKPSGSHRLEKGFEGYDVRLFDDPSAMMDLVRMKNREANKARMLAGYCWDWVSDKDPSKNDISLPGGFSAQWNFAGTSTWAIDPDSVEQIGCIHTSQGLEFDYVGVILGPDIVYRDGKVIALPGERARTDKSLSGYKGGSLPQKTAKEIVINTYRTLLTRGQKGCYIYCVDPGMQEWTRRLLDSWFGEK